jgi:uncharacterized protein (TIGR00251 family)
VADPLELVPTAGGVRLKLRVKPGGRANRLIGPHGGALKLEVQAPPDKGKANQAVIKLLAALLGVARSDVEITAGITSQDKTVEIRGLTADQLTARLGL